MSHLIPQDKYFHLAIVVVGAKQKYWKYFAVLNVFFHFVLIYYANKWAKLIVINTEL